MAKRDSNIDPFNAGEPVSPWQDPESETRDDEGQEAYGAPHHGDSTPKPPIGQMTGFASNNANGPKEPRTRRRSADSLKREMARQARAQRTRNKTPGSIARRIFKLILGILILFLLLSTGSSIASCAASLFTPSAPNEPYDIPAFEEDEDSPEAQCLLLANTRMEHLLLAGTPEHAAVADRIAAAFTQRIENDFDLTPDELGVNPAIVAEWVIGSLIYKGVDTHAFPEADDPYASVYFDVEACSMMTMYYEFQSDLYDYLSEQGLYLLDIKQGKELADAQKTDIADILQAMRVRLTLQDDTWKIDEADFERYCDYIFGMPA